jgi:hypothetical protein
VDIYGFIEYRRSKVLFKREIDDINKCIKEGIPVRRNMHRVVVKRYVKDKLKDVTI